MKKIDLELALRALAQKHPNAEHIGTVWKNPLNPRSKGRRWTHTTIDMVRKLQAEYR